MTNPKHRTILSFFVMLAPALAMPIGCGEKDAPAQEPVARAPVNRPPPPPRWTLEDIDVHEKVTFPSHNAPRSEEVARAVGSFASAFAAGDNIALQSMLSDRDRVILDTMVQHGEWDELSRDLVGLRIVVVEETGGGAFRVGLGVQGPHGVYLTGWEAVGGGNAWTFSALDVGNVQADQLAILDGASLQAPAAPSESSGSETLSPPPAQSAPPPPTNSSTGSGFGGG